MAVFADITPERVGNVVGFVVLLSLSLAGIVKCVRIVRRPTAHTLCVVALLLVLLGFAGSSISVFLGQMQLLPFGVLLATTSINLFLYVASFVTATIGLIDFRKHRDIYTQGTAQAKWALGLSAFLLTAFCTTLYSNLKPLIAERLAAAQPAAPTPEHKPENGPTLSPVNPTKSTTFTEKELAGKRVLDAYNLAFYLPGKPWTELQPQTVNPDAKLVLTQDQSNITFVIIPERLGVEKCPDMSRLSDISESRIKGHWGTLVTVNRREETYNGLTGLHLSGDPFVGGRATHQSVWITVKNGFVYQLLASGSKADAEKIDDALRDMCQRFQQVEPNLVAHSEGYDDVREFESKSFGYRIELPDTGWSSLAKPALEASGAEFGADSGEHAMVAVLPVQLAARKPDLEVLASAMLRQVHVSYPGADIISSAKIEEDKRPGLAIEAWGNDRGVRRRSLLRVMAGDRSAILIWGLLLTDDAPTRAAVEAAIGRVKIVAGKEAKDPSLTDAQRLNSALVNNELGIAAHGKGDFATASEYFAIAFQLNPDGEAILANYVDTLTRLNRGKEALAVVQRQVAKAPQNLALRGLEARFLAEQGDPVKARQIFVELFNGDYFNERNFLTYITLAVEAGAFDEAIDLAEKVVQRQPTIQVRRNLAVLYGRKGQHDKAIELLETVHKQFPSDIGTSNDLAEVYEVKGDYSAALAIIQKLIDSGHRDEATLVSRGRNQLQLHWYAQAKKTFEDALVQYPSSRVVKDFLSQASNLLGEGDNSLLKTPLEAVEIPPVVRAKIQEAKRAKKASSSASDKYDATEMLSVTGIEYRRGKPMRTTTWREVKIYTTGGVTRYSSMTMRFNPAYERVFVNRLAVFDASGKQVAEGSVNNYYALDDNSSGQAKQHKLLNTPVPGLKPGYTLRFVVTTEELIPVDSFRFQNFVLSSAVPVGVGAVFVHGDIASIASSSTQQAKVERTSDVIYCVEANPTQYYFEPNQPPIEYHLPIVWMGESGGNWEEIGRSYLKDIKEKLASSDDTRQIAAELTKDCHTQREKVVALASHVQNAFTYQAIEFGRRAMIPNPPSQTLHLKYGDCKDHAVLLRELLDCVKIPAHLALVKTSSHLRSEMPSLDQFNHMVVYVPKLPGETAGDTSEELILDCTDKYTYPLLTPPVGLADKELLVLDPDKPRLVRTGKFPDDAARLVSQRKIRVTPEGDSGSVRTEVDEHVTLNQFLAPSLRGYLRMYEPADRTAAVQAYFNEESRLHLDHVTIENLDEFDKPLVVDMKYAVPEAFHVVASAERGTTLVGHLPSPWERAYFQAGYVQQRKSPFEFTMPVRLESTVEFEVPKGFELKDADQLAHTEQTPFIAWASRSSLEGNAIKLEYRARRFAGRHRADEYSTYYEDAKKALALFDRPLLIQAIGAKPADNR